MPITQGQGCPAKPPLEPAICADLENAGIVNVECEHSLSGGGTAYAHPDDNCDDTDGIQAALTHAKGRYTVYLPPGQVTNGKSSPYIVSAPIEVNGGNPSIGAALRGELHSDPDQGTRIQVAGSADLSAASGDPDCNELPLVSVGSGTGSGCQLSGTGVCKAGAVLAVEPDESRVEDIVIDAKDRADYGVFVYCAAQGVLNNVVVRDARHVGAFVEDSVEVRLENVEVRSGAKDGMWLVGNNSGSLRNSAATSNARHGIVVSFRPGSNHGGGAFQLANVQVFNNGTVGPPHSGHGLYVLKAPQPVAAKSLNIEKNVLDGVRAELSDNFSLLHSRVFLYKRDFHPVHTEESLNHGVALVDCRHCIVRGNTIEGSHQESEDIWIEANSKDGRYPIIAENIFDSANLGPTDYIGGGNSFEVKYAGAAGVSRYTQHNNRSLANGAPPTAGTWRRGDVVWNRSPGAGQPLGWVCSATAGVLSFQCTSWRAFSVLP